MTNDTTDNNPEEAVHCFALSKNDSYVMSASGGKISLFNMMTFKVGKSLHFDTFSFFFVETIFDFIFTADDDNIYACTASSNFSCISPPR
jgi:WD40 repeat protein